MIAVVVEGIGEIEAIKFYISKIDKTVSVVGRPYHADLQPKANPRVIATAARPVINQLKKRGVTKILIVIDLEDRPCPLRFAQQLKGAFDEFYDGVEITPVIKHHCFENWMIADPDALRALRKRFKNVEIIEAAIKKNGADAVQDPLGLLDRCSIKTEYHKTIDPSRIAAQQDIDRLAVNSRSFKGFVKELGHRPLI